MFSAILPHGTHSTAGKFHLFKCAEEAESKLKKRKYENERNNKMKEAGRTPIES